MKFIAASALASLLVALPLLGADADPLKQERTKVIYIYKRLAGVPPLGSDVEKWAAEIMATGNREALYKQVAAAATLKDSFLSKTVLNFAEIETNEEREINDNTASLSDLSATVIGAVRDGLDYRQILSADLIYLPKDAIYNAKNNAIYETLYNQVKNGQTTFTQSLVKSTQSSVTGLSEQAGIFTLRGYGSVYYNDGTNRSPVRFTFINYLCKDMEDFSDVTLSDAFVRRDVDRAPGGDPSKYRNECVGCHAGLDPLSKAFTFYDWKIENQDAFIVIDAQPAAKVNRNNTTFPQGAIVSDDSWQNLWTAGNNAKHGFDKTLISGVGSKSFGEMLAASQMFPSCMAKRVCNTVCLKDGKSLADQDAINKLSEGFVKSDFNMKALFQNAAIQCAEQLQF